MINKCKCGGKVVTKDENIFYFRSQCDKCKKIYRQRKRLGKSWYKTAKIV